MLWFCDACGAARGVGEPACLVCGSAEYTEDLVPRSAPEPAIPPVPPAVAEPVPAAEPAALPEALQAIADAAGQGA